MLTFQPGQVIKAWLMPRWLHPCGTAHVLSPHALCVPAACAHSLPAAPPTPTSPVPLTGLTTLKGFSTTAYHRGHHVPLYSLTSMDTAHFQSHTLLGPTAGFQTLSSVSQSRHSHMHWLTHTLTHRFTLYVYLDRFSHYSLLHQDPPPLPAFSV